MKVKEWISILCVFVVFVVYLSTAVPHIHAQINIAGCRAEDGSLGLAVYSNSTYYICIPFIETEDEAQGVVFLAEMPSRNLVEMELRSSDKPVQIAIRVFDPGLTLVGSATAVLSANQSKAVGINLSRDVDACVVELVVNGNLAKVFAVRYMEKAERIEIERNTVFDSASYFLLMMLPATPLLGFMLRATPRASAVLMLVSSWALLAVVSWLSGFTAMDNKVVVAMYGAVVIYSILALILWRKG